MGYVEEFEKTIKNFPNRRFIDAAEGGARIKGAEVMPPLSSLSRQKSV